MPRLDLRQEAPRTSVLGLSASCLPCGRWMWVTRETSAQIVGPNLMVDPILSDLSERSKYNGANEERCSVTFSGIAESNK